MKARVEDGKSLQNLITGLVREGVKSALAQKALTEKEKQVQATGSSGDEESSGGGVEDLFGGSGDAGDEETDDNAGDTSSKTMDDEKEKLAKSEVKPRDIVEKLNSIRSGKSFKDSYVAKAMDEYIGSLSKTERVALLAFVKGIAQIVTGEVPAQNAADPGDHPSDVKMQKTNEPKVIHKDPNVIKGAGDQKPQQANAGTGKKPPPAEDDTPPAPITPKRR